MDAPRFVSRFLPAPPPGDAVWTPFRGMELLVKRAEGGRFRLLRTEEIEGLGLAIVRSQYLGTLGDLPCISAELADDAMDIEGHKFANVRAAHGRLDQVEFDLACFGFQIQYWDRNYRYCPSCAGPIMLKATERAKRCDPCDRDFFPPVVPATIVRVTRGDSILLTRQSRFPPGMYGLVAGFLEPGETLEACVAREVYEETRIRVKGVRYFGSQPWPFPHQVMVAFCAEYESGEIIVDKSELEEALWFDRAAMPMLPPPLSIARLLIDDWLGSEK
jgi:NAD+ diphosphatase